MKVYLLLYYINIKSPSFLDKKFLVTGYRFTEKKTGRMNPTPTFEIATLYSKAMAIGKKKRGVDTRSTPY
jgi:hypothetical protein